MTLTLVVPPATIDSSPVVSLRRVSRRSVGFLLRSRIFVLSSFAELRRPAPRVQRAADQARPVRAGPVRAVRELPSDDGGTRDHRQLARRQLPQGLAPQRDLLPPIAHLPDPFGRVA